MGVDNVDFVACNDLGIPISNAPGIFGIEVVVIALGYVVALAGLSLLGTLKVKNPSKRGVLRSKVCTTSGLATGRPVGS